MLLIAAILGAPDADAKLIPVDMTRDEPPGGLHLRSMCDVAGCLVDVTNGGIGYVHDFIIEDTKGIVRYFVADA